MKTPHAGEVTSTIAASYEFMLNERRVSLPTLEVDGVPDADALSIARSPIHLGRP